MRRSGQWAAHPAERRGSVMTEPSATGLEAREPADDFVADLPGLAVLRVGGKDAVDFLGGQLTSDVWRSTTEFTPLILTLDF